MSGKSKISAGFALAVIATISNVLADMLKRVRYGNFTHNMLRDPFFWNRILENALLVVNKGKLTNVTVCVDLIDPSRFDLRGKIWAHFFTWSNVTFVDETHLATFLVSDQGISSVPLELVVISVKTETGLRVVAALPNDLVIDRLQQEIMTYSP
jgi:hypothetical protein